MKINERWEELKEETHANIQSEKGILNRQVRSIQTEGHLGDIKENEDFNKNKGDIMRSNERAKEKEHPCQKIRCRKTLILSRVFIL